ncbi:MAG: hypothetical protein QOH09_4133 [Pseudonocardiales bacterium]|jgi:hypothetical protein|nr:hypothetical protein [Pseudonocardiales bacterium]
MAVMDYQTRDGLTYYGFSIDFEPGIGWRVYIIFQPFHQGHDDSLQLPYQARDNTGRRYVDWSEKIDNLADAKTVASALGRGSPALPAHPRTTRALCQADRALPAHPRTKTGHPSGLDRIVK